MTSSHPAMMPRRAVPRPPVVRPRKRPMWPDTIAKMPQKNGTRKPHSPVKSQNGGTLGIVAIISVPNNPAERLYPAALFDEGGVGGLGVAVGG